MAYQNKIVQFLSFWVGNTIVLLVLSTILSGNVVLGNERIAKPIAGILAGFILTLVNVAIPIAAGKSGYKIKKENIWAAIYFVAYTIVIWIIKRLADFTGLGISSVLFVLIVAVLLTLTQWGVYKVTESLLKNK